MNEEEIRFSTEMRNHYNELFGLSCAENDLLDILAKADEDVKSGRVAPMKDTFDDLRSNAVVDSRKDYLNIIRGL